LWEIFTAFSMPQCLNASMPLRLCSTLAVTAAVFFSGAPGQAQIIFSDNFDANSPLLNGIPAGWTIGNSGTVDIIGQCSGSGPLFDFLPGNGCYIDLDGSTMNSGLLKKSFSLASGFDYILEFDLASNQNNIVDVGFGPTTATYSLLGAQPQPFTTKSFTFTPAISGTYDVSFLNRGGDNNGIILDNVKITKTPGPLPILGVAAAFRASRRLRARLRRAQP
jgi:hypothetical protein